VSHLRAEERQTLERWAVPAITNLELKCPVNQPKQVNRKEVRRTMENPPHSKVEQRDPILSPFQDDRRWQMFS
jgi:hypothetical protein